MNADLRALAERLGMFRDCECAMQHQKYVRVGGAPGEYVAACVACSGTGHRLPTEAEVRAAIFEASVTWVETGSSRAFAYVMFGGDDEYRTEAHAEEAEADDLVLLALLRALKVARSGC
jgi:hypothetical protein